MSLCQSDGESQCRNVNIKINADEIKINPTHAAFFYVNRAAPGPYSSLFTSVKRLFFTFYGFSNLYKTSINNIFEKMPKINKIHYTIFDALVIFYYYTLSH